jgi:uncharacterized protein YqeY
MTIKARIEKDIIAGMRAKDSHLVETLRMIKTAIKNKEVSGKVPTALTDLGVIAVISTAIKQRNESAEAFKNGDRHELAEKELKEITILEKYMPRTATMAEIIYAIGQEISDNYKLAPTMKDMGKIIKAVQERLQVMTLHADGKVVSGLVKEKLSELEWLIKHSGCAS